MLSDEGRSVGARVVSELRFDTYSRRKRECSKYNKLMCCGFESSLIWLKCYVIPDHQ